VDETRVSAEALASSCFRIRASAAVFVGLLESTVDVLRAILLDWQVESNDQTILTQFFKNSISTISII
jgi:hypothetical protein